MTQYHNITTSHSLSHTQTGPSRRIMWVQQWMGQVGQVDWMWQVGTLLDCCCAHLPSYFTSTLSIHACLHHTHPLFTFIFHLFILYCLSVLIWLFRIITISVIPRMSSSHPFILFSTFRFLFRHFHSLWSFLKLLVLLFIQYSITNRFSIFSYLVYFSINS